MAKSTNPKIDLEISFTVNLGQYESLRAGMRLSDIEVLSDSAEDIEKARKAASRMIIKGISASFRDVNEYFDKEFFEEVKRIKEKIKEKRNNE